jgi:NAD(P)-dependent dehydrogenase (short-subunit alcohol dehydrogenase family)
VDLGLSDKVAVVGGASRGIGRAIVEQLVAEGAYVVAGARQPEDLEGERVSAVRVDLSTEDGPLGLVQAAIEAHGAIDFVVNNVGGGRLHFGGLVEASDADWQWAFDTNIMSAVRTIRAALPHVTKPSGAIVNISSLNGRIPAVEAPEYSAMKAALNTLSRGLALELAGAGVRVNVVSPGLVRTDMQIGPGGVAEQVAAISGSSVDDYVSEVERSVPLGRFAEPADIASVVVSLLSDRFGYVTGADIAVDGATQSG